MGKFDKLKQEYDYIKDNYSSSKKNELKIKLIELDKEFSKEYEHELDILFPMTTTLNKEEIRLENLISFVEKNSKIQNDYINDYKKITGEVIELSYLKYSDNIKEFKIRLNNVRKILDIINEIKELYISDSKKNEFKIKSISNKLLKKEYLNLLYEFCLIDKIDVENIDINKLINNEEEIVKDDKNYNLIKEEIKEPIKEEVIEEVIPEEKEEEHEEKILTTMPKIDKIGSVVPVNVFESIDKAEEKLPDVVLPTNGLKDSENDIFLDTKDMFDTEEEKK